MPLLPILLDYLGSLLATFQYWITPTLSFEVMKFPERSFIQMILLIVFGYGSNRLTTRVLCENPWKDIKHIPLSAKLTKRLSSWGSQARSVIL